jgi:uncharacterized phage protein (TIGR02216 family)
MHPLQPFPWREAIGFGLGVRRLPPQQFWRMTPRELACAIEAATGRGGAPLPREALNELMQRFPDGAR